MNTELPAPAAEAGTRFALKPIPGIRLNARRGKDFDTLHFSAPPFSTFQGYALLAVKLRGMAQLHVTAAAGSPESLSLALRVTDKLFPPLARYGRGQKITNLRYCVVCNTPQCDGLSAVKTDYGYRAYDVFRLEDGAWVWCGYGNGRAMLPKYVRKRLAEGRPAECVVEGYRYCIKPPSRAKIEVRPPR